MKDFGSKYSIILPYLLFVGVGLLRLEASHPFNLIPIFSCLLFFASRRPGREFAVPFIALVAVDIYLTTHRYGFSLTSGQGVTWIWYLFALMCGDGMLKGSASIRRAIGVSLLMSLSFFVVSNFTVWAEWEMYPRTVAGLTACYFAALPFFRNSAVSELACSLLLFGLTGYVEALLPGKSIHPACS